MDETSPLVEQATTTLVRSMTDDDAPAWQATLEGFAALFAKASHVAAAELERSRTEVASRPHLAAEAAGEWKPKLRRLLSANPEVATQLRTLLRELDAERPQAGVSNRIDGTVSGSAVQAGTIHGGVTHHDGDHIDFSGGTFNAKVVGKEEHHHEDTHVDQSHASAGRDVIGVQNNDHGRRGPDRQG
ncbi:hypothetical protein ACFXKD_00190 [Nocardiopsis aegyptia]|uniref:hypothetical protein n=1 Tax=Nocardiopsis aegyptia TaxID=220378 RepID=UPI00367260F8